MLKRRYKRVEAPKGLRKRRRRDEVDPIDEIPDAEWDEILFSVLEAPDPLADATQGGL